MPVADTARPPKPEKDVYELVAFTAAIASIGFLIGPAMTLGFAWAFAVTAIVVGRRSRADATASLIVGVIVAISAAVAMVSSSW